MADKITWRQLTAVAAAGLTALGAWCLAGLGWQSAWLGLAAAAVIHFIFGEAARKNTAGAAGLTEIFGLWPGRFLAALEALWLAAVLGWLALRACGAFPGQAMFPIVGLVLLALSWAAAGRGGGVAVRCGAVCFLFLAALYTAILAFAVPEASPETLFPNGVTAEFAAFDLDLREALLAMALCLLPAAGLALRPTGDAEVRGPAIWGLLFLAAAPLLTAACLGPALTAALPAPFYTMVQTISVLGVMERFEGVICAAEQVGAFCLMGLLAAAAGRGMGEAWEAPERPFSGAVLLLAVPCMWIPEEIGQAVTAAGSLIFCGALPLTALLLRKLRMPARKSET